MNNEGWCKKNCPYNTDCSCDGVCNFILSLLKEKESTINELQNAYGYLQKQFFEAQDKLLKEQEAQKFFVDEYGKITPLPVVVRCKDCKHGCIAMDGMGNDIVECMKSYKARRLDWFCADGERS